MRSFCKNVAALLVFGGALVPRGSSEESVDTDYSAPRLAQSHAGSLPYLTSEEQLRRPLRNGLGMHDDAVFVVDGATFIGSSWDGVVRF